MIVAVRNRPYRSFVVMTQTHHVSKLADACEVNKKVSKKAFGFARNHRGKRGEGQRRVRSSWPRKTRSGRSQGEDRTQSRHWRADQHPRQEGREVSGCEGRQRRDQNARQEQEKLFVESTPPESKQRLEPGTKPVSIGKPAAGRRRSLERAREYLHLPEPGQLRRGSRQCRMQ